MQTNAARCLSSALIALLLNVGVSNGQLLVNLNDSTIPSNLQCNELWTDSDIALNFTTTGNEDYCPGSCWFEPTVDGVAIFGRLNADLGDVPGIVVSVEVDVEPYCPTDCVRAFLYEDGALIDYASNLTSGFQTLVVFAGANAADWFAVSGCKSFMYAIRVTLQLPNGVEVVERTEAFSVGVAAPNPFAHHTELQFRIATESPVQVAIYDVRGVRVRSILEGRLAAGAHVADWDGRTDGGLRAAAGVYFYEVRAGADVGRSKVVRLR